jgi:hypothetical protein
MGHGQCSRLKPSYKFHFEGLLKLSSSAEGLVQIQNVDLRIYQQNKKLTLKLCMNFI